MTSAEPPASAASPGSDVPFVEVYDEPLHPTVLENDYVRVLRVSVAPNSETLYHRHSQDSFFLFFRHAQVQNTHVGREPFEVELEAGSFYWGDHLRNPIIHKISIQGDRKLDCIDLELKADRPKPASQRTPLPNTPHREKCFENDVMRAYRVKIAPGQSLHGAEEGSAVTFPCIFAAMKDAKLSRGDVKTGDTWWGDGEPGDRLETNVGEEETEVMILEPK